MPDSITGNKGEWSEMYVLLRLLGEGRIFAADENVNRIDTIYFPILKVIREEIVNRKYQYKIGDSIQIFLNDTLIKEISHDRFTQEANYLYDKILQGTNRAFSICETENFMREIGCSRLSAPSTDKTDITMQIHDIQTGYAPICGFSIKSEIGNPPTLVNATRATNFEYEITGLSDDQINCINAIDTQTKIKDRMQRIFSDAASVSFVKTSSDMFHRNLMLIDSRMTELLAAALLYHYRDDISSCVAVVDSMEDDNPLGFPSRGFYKYKFKKFLCSVALGMTPAREWDGIDEANGGYIIVTATGDVLAYHIYNRAFFEEYLLHQTRFERGSTSRHGFAELYKRDGKTYLNLNMQIRFIH